MAETKLYKKGLAITVALAVLTLAPFSVYLWSENKQESPHYVDLACAVCHTYVADLCESEDCLTCHPPDNLVPYQQLKAPELVLCTSCHDREGETEVQNEDGIVIKVDLGASHPWGMGPGRHSPSTLPLKEGKIVCQTCHDVHLTNAESHMLRLYIPIYDENDSTRADFTPLCLDCHHDY
jgi:predicted CXXCH cytochrome family protein